MWVDSNDDSDPYNRLNAAPTAPQSTDVSVGAGGGSGTPGAASSKNGTASTPSTQAPAQTTGPTQNFASIQDYLGNNQQQGEDLGSNVTGNLNQAATADQNAIAGAANQTQSDITNGTTNYNADLVSRAVANPTSITNNPDQLQSFLGQWNAAYTGPSSFETSNNYDTAATANTDAQQKQAEVATPGGQQQLLSDQFGDYGEGNKNLDQNILANSSYAPQVQAEGQNFQNVQDYLTTQAGALDTAATNAAANTAAAKTQTQAAFANEPTTFQNQINAETAAAQAPATTQAAQFAADFQSGDPTKVVADLKQADPNIDASTIQQYLTALNAQNGKPTDLSQFYSFNPTTAVTTANAATAQDYANAAALSQLTGVDYSGILNPANAAQAGTAPNATSGINASGIADYLKTQYANSELNKLGAPALTPGTTTSTPNATVNPTLATPTSTPTDVAGAGAGAAAGSGIGGVVAGPLGTTIGGYLGATLGGQSGLSKSINNALGIGAGSASHDATVNLPTLSLPQMSMPANADPAATKTVIDVFNQPLSTSGSYHEGALYDMVGRIQSLNTLMTQGQITPAEYAAYSQPLIAWSTQAAQSIMGASSAAANAGRPAWNQLQALIAPAVSSPVKAFAGGGVAEAPTNLQNYFKKETR